MTRQTHTSRIPKYRLHRPTGLGVVRLNGRDIYLGRHGTPESQAEYRRVIGEWLASAKAVASLNTGEQSAPPDFAVSELVFAYLEFARTYYVKHGEPTGEFDNVRDALRPLVSLYGPKPVAAFGPLSLKAVRQGMVESGLCRGVVNARTNRIRRTFKWGVENQLVCASVLHGLQAVAPLKQGRCNVREAAPVRPVPDAHVDAVLQVAPAPIAAMIELQRLTGMRPGEVVLMRAGDLDTSGPIWTYRPPRHKTEHHGRERTIYLGPQAQRVLSPCLKRDIEAFLFSPKDAVAQLRLTARQDRRTPLTPSQRQRTKKRDPKRAAGDRYTTGSYARAIDYACDKAFPHPELANVTASKLTPEQQKTLAEWRRAHRWSPNQLRHNAATFLRKQFGIEAARVVLGHSSAQVTEIYAERDLAAAADIMARVG